MNPPHHRSTPSSPPTMEPSQTSAVDSPPTMNADEDEQIRPSKWLKSSVSISADRHGSTSSSPSTAEPFQPCLIDSVHSSPPMDAIASIREMLKNIDPVKQIGSLICLVESHIQKMNALSEAGSSSSEVRLDTVRDFIKLAAKVIDTISTESEKLSNSNAVVEALRSVTLKVIKGMGDLYWVFTGLSIATYAVENCLSVGCTEKEWREVLVKIVELAKKVKEYSERMPDEKESLCNAVGIIAEGAVIFCDYLKRAKDSRFWSPTIAADQLKKTNRQLTDVRDSLSLSRLREHWDKDVFLSHSGKQKNFVRKLHEDLARHNVSCFFDEDRRSLPLGERFPLLMFKAAENCKIAVLVLSKEFLCSKWPMSELSAFIKAKKSGKNPNLKLLPIFFMIEPRELSGITRDSPEWEKLGVNNDTRVEWEEALKDFSEALKDDSSIPELTFSEIGNEVDLRKEAMKEISWYLNRSNVPKLLEVKPVGIEEKVREVKALLDMEGAQSALAVIVCGFGGIGKSTLAASVVESLDWSSMYFKFCRVAIDNKTQDKTCNIKDLQKVILSDLGEDDVDVKDTLYGRLKIRKALENKCSFLFIDNVVEKNDIGELLPNNLLYSGQDTKLRILITSRENDLREKVRIMWKDYEVKALSYATSKLLLSETIEQSQEVANIGRDEEERLIKDVAFECKGVPLLLSIFGRYLRDERDKDSYQQVLSVLREGNLNNYRDEDLGTTIMYVYNKIENVEVKEAFLDICTYFSGWEWNLVADIVDNYVLEELHRKMLVSKGGSGHVIIHDILLLMGLTEAGQSRFSNWKKLSDALEDDLYSLINVKGISLLRDNHLIPFPFEKLEAMRLSLRVLMLGDWVILEGRPCQEAFPNLRYLRVGDISAFPFSELDKLRVFINGSKLGMNLSKLPSSLKRICYEVPEDCNEFPELPFQNLSTLKSFIVETAESVKLPKALHLPVSLVDLDLSRCKNLPENIGHLSALESLILDKSDLKRLRGFGKLKKLKHLRIDYCSELSFLSDEFGMLYSLERLGIKYCSSLQLLPESIGELRISSLQLCFLSSLKELPNGFGNMPFLEDLSIESCDSLMSLPDSFGKLKMLETLKIDSCHNLSILPKDFGNMPFLKDLSLVSCSSLMSLPDSFVQLKMLETLKIYDCKKLSILPKDFGQLRCLKHMTVEGCELLKELPCGFGALPALKTFSLKRCDRFKNLPRNFGELTSLEELHLQMLPLNRIPDGLGKLKGLRLLFLDECRQLKTLFGDFENMATLERLRIWKCPKLEGVMMEKILKLQNCSMAYIGGSTKLSEKWKLMHSTIKHPFLVLSGDEQIDGEVQKRALMEALLNGECEVNKSSGQLMERSSLLGGLGEGNSATVAVILLPEEMLSSQHLRCIQSFSEMARERAESNEWGMLHIVCARRYVWSDRRPIPTEEEEKEQLRQILLSMPEGCCAISKRVKMFIPYDVWEWELTLSDRYMDLGNSRIMFFIGHVVDMEGSKSFENFEEVTEYEVSKTVILEEEEEEEMDEKKGISEEELEWEWESEKKSIPELVHSIMYGRVKVAGQSNTREFIEGLKGNGIDHLLIKGKKVMVDDLHGKTIGFIKCKPILSEWIKLIQIYKDLQEDSDFIVILIPTDWPKSRSFGYGRCLRASQCMPWAIIPHRDWLAAYKGIEYRGLVVQDKEGRIAEEDAYALLMGWGLKFYPFTDDSIRESFSMMESESVLEILLHGMNIVGRKPMKNKMTFLYVASPMRRHKMECKLEELSQIHGFEILYVGERSKWERNTLENVEKFKKEYEDATQEMSWPSLSISDRFMFWNRCSYFAKDFKDVELYRETNKMQAVRGLAKQLCFSGRTWLVLVDNDGVVTGRGEDVVKMIGELSELSENSVFQFVKRWFGNEIDNHPQHPQHRLSLIMPSFWMIDYMCNVCSCDQWEERWYECGECSEWHMCGRCWMEYAKQHAQQLVRSKHN